MPAYVFTLNADGLDAELAGPKTVTIEECANEEVARWQLLQFLALMLCKTGIDGLVSTECTPPRNWLRDLFVRYGSPALKADGGSAGAGASEGSDAGAGKGTSANAV